MCWTFAVGIGFLPLVFAAWLAASLAYPKLVAWSASSPERFAACGQLEAIDELIDGLQPMPGITHFVRSLVCDSTQFARAVRSLNGHVRDLALERIQLSGACSKISEAMRETALSIPSARHRSLLDDADRHANMCNRMTDNIDARKDKLKEQLGTLEEQVGGGPGSFGNMGQTLRGMLAACRNLDEVVDEHRVAFSKFADSVREHVSQACGPRSSADWVDWLFKERFAPSTCDKARIASLIDDHVEGIRRFHVKAHEFQADAEELEQLIQGNKQ